MPVRPIESKDLLKRVPVDFACAVVLCARHSDFFFHVTVAKVTYGYMYTSSVPGLRGESGSHL